jgi:hypothetical protein
MRLSVTDYRLVGLKAHNTRQISGLSAIPNLGIPLGPCGRMCRLSSSRHSWAAHRMRRFQSIGSPLIAAALFVVVSNSGCLDPRFTRLPTVFPSNPVAENRAIQQTDPFPDPDLGPKTFARPRSFSRPRTEPRRAAEQRMLRGLQIGPEYIPPYYAPSARRYSNAVH